MYYSSGNYEAFARPKKPAGVDSKHISSAPVWRPCLRPVTWCVTARCQAIIFIFSKRIPYREEPAMVSIFLVSVM